MLASTLPLGPAEIPAVDFEGCGHKLPCTFTDASSISACFVCPFSHEVTLGLCAPKNVSPDGVVDLRLAVHGVCKGDRALAVTAARISTHVQAAITIVTLEGDLVSLTVPVSSNGRLVTRLLLAQHHWAGAVSIVIESLTFAGRPLLCDLLPATAQVGYNHAPAPAGDVFRAALRDDVQEMKSALHAGGSTEETHEVRGLIER